MLLTFGVDREVFKIYFYTKISRVSRVEAIKVTDTGDEKMTGEVPT